MADYEDDGSTVHPADPPQQLVDLVGSIDDPQAHGAVRDASVRLQDYMVQRQMADDNAAAADRLVNNLGTFKDGLASLAGSDPGAIGVGLSVAPDMIDAFVSLNPFLPEDQKPAIRDSITQDVQREVVRSGVMSAANRDEAQARRLLDAHDDYLSDGDRVGLHGYISAMATARSLDADAGAQQTAQDAERMTNHSTVNYLSTLVDPQTGELQFPPGWAQKVTSDRSLPPAQTAAMLHTFNKVRQGGDGETDWHTFADMTSRIAAGEPPALNEVLSQVGQGLKAADAVTLARGSNDAIAPATQREFRQLDATISAARNVLAPPEYGIAGQRAFERFMDWMVPQYRNAGPGSLNPKAETYILPSGDEHNASTFWNQFAPRLDDFVVGQRPAGFEMKTGETNDRMSLEDIFSRRSPPAGDQVIRQPRPAFDRGHPSHAADRMMLDDERLAPGPVQGGNPGFNEDGSTDYFNPEIKS